VTASVDRAGPVVEVAGLRKGYSGRRVVDDVTFQVDPGEIFALLGPNGAGKTTTVEIVEGYRAPDAGSVAVFGVDPRRAGRDGRARVGLMLQGGGGIDPRMTAREVVGLHAGFHARPRNPDETLRLVGLTEAAARTRYRRLSGGERQRVGLALALVGRPDLAILDEPTAGMDVEARAATRDILGQLRADGVAILLTSHDLTDVERLADRIGILDRGRLVALGRPYELSAGSAPLIRFRLAAPLADADRASLAARLADSAGDVASGGPGDVTVVPDGNAGRYRVDGLLPSPAAVAALGAWCEVRGALIVELRTAGASLEERYLELTGSAAGDRTAGNAT